MKNRTWRQRKIDYIKVIYGRTYKMYESVDPHDDRRLFLNIIDQIVEAINSIPEEPLPFVAVSMNNHIHEQFEILDDIQSRFKGRETA